MAAAAVLRRHPIACYLTLTYAVTWSAWLPLAISGRGVTIGFSPLYLLGLLGPMIGALATTALLAGWRGLRALLARMVRVRVGARWWLVALGLPLGTALVYFAAVTAGGGRIDRDGLGAFNGFAPSGVVALWLWLTLVNGYGEETGWRGFLLRRLSRRRSPLAASLLLAVCWAIWHIPAFWVTETYRQMPVATIPMFFVGLVSGAIFLTWLFNRGRQSILLVAVWHGTFNLFSGTVGSRGTLAAIESTIVTVIAAALVVAEWRAMRAERRGRPVHHVMAISPSWRRAG